MINSLLPLHHRYTRCSSESSESKKGLLQHISESCSRAFTPIVESFKNLKSSRGASLLKENNTTTDLNSKNKYRLSKGWQDTVKDIREVRNLRKKLPFGGYPFRRLQINQTGDGLVNAAIAGIGLAALGMNPIIAGVLPFGIRATELIVAAVWNQRMATERREARIAASHIHNALDFSDQPSPGLSKKKSAQQIISSTKYDFIAGVATIGAIGLLIVGGPAWGVIGLGVAIAVCQTLSKFKEMAWGALRYVVNEDPELRKQQVDLQEPMSAYEMALNVGIMTFSYLIGFGTIFAIHTFAAPVALPITIAMAAVGTILMVGAKRGFKKEMQEGIEEHETLQQKYQLNAVQNEKKIALENEWEKSLSRLKISHASIQLPVNFHTNTTFDWSYIELFEVYKACHSNKPPELKQINDFFLVQQQLYTKFDPTALDNIEERIEKRDKARSKIYQNEEKILHLTNENQNIYKNT
ncbi:MAG: hypothetical protein V4629_13885 [Pseudomonadota bacterium]